MKTLLLTCRSACLGLALLLAPAAVMAMTCKTRQGESIIRADLGSSVAIPASLPDGTAVWRSERLNLSVVCAKDGQPGLTEEVSIYLNPDNLLVGQGVIAGLTLNGVDHLQSQGRIGTQQFLPACGEDESNVGACPTVSFNLPFSVFIQKSGPVPPSGVASDLLDYRMFQLDSALGMNPLPDNNLSYVINNLTGLRFVACDAELRVMPDVVEFGQVPIRNVQVGKVADFRRFALATSRVCDSPFSLDARFTPISGVLSGDVLVPANNSSIGIRITHAGSGTPLRYNEPFHLNDLLGENYSATADFNAELLWQTTSPEAGPFDAEVMVDLFYK
ncbi:fimbrial protein [Pseudomonas huanghezhanensis]|uniref:fimbrial protein n=1 Tax=Pseudomonas huanghezhanensis TaxID=3002903 RepID=UPI002285E88E|nr:fimbrial protein [Pseudomonas sp. BSw22131]